MRQAHVLVHGRNKSGIDCDTASATCWTTIATPSQPVHTDTVPVFNQRLGVLNSKFCYRVRARNACGWSDFSDVMEADLIDKISCQSPRHVDVTPKSNVYYGSASSRSSGGLLPHGITLRSESAGSHITKTYVGATAQHVRKKTGDKRSMSLISDEQKRRLLQEDMLSVPQYYQATSRNEPVYSVSSNGPPTRHEDSDTNIIQCAPNKPGKYGQNPVLDTESSLAGDALDGVDGSLESWLCRLAEACPLELESTNHPSLPVGNDLFDDRVVDEWPSETNATSAAREDLIGRVSNSLGNQSKDRTPILDTLYHESGMNPKQVQLKQPKRSLMGGRRKAEASGGDFATGQDEADHDESVLLKLARTHAATHDMKQPAFVSSKSVPNKMFALH